MTRSEMSKLLFEGLSSYVDSIFGYHGNEHGFRNLFLLTETEEEVIRRRFPKLFYPMKRAVILPHVLRRYSKAHLQVMMTEYSRLITWKDTPFDFHLREVVTVREEESGMV